MTAATRPLSRALALTLFALSPVLPSPSASAASDPWNSEVSGRIRDAAHAFVGEGGAFVAEVPEQRLTARFDADGAALDGDGIAVRTVGWGRPGAMDPLLRTAPRLGACLGGREDPAGRCVQRLDYAAAGLTTWWASEADGFEQGWTVQAAPPAEGPLAIDVAVAGATVGIRDGELWLDSPQGDSWIVSGLVAWDADGTPLDARFDPVAGGYRVTVADADARYPIEIDPVYSTASATITGENVGDSFGFAVSGAGDTNGDGYDDVIVGALGFNLYTGRAYVFLGSASGLSTTASATLNGEAINNEFGETVSDAGDINGDGYDDVIVGAPDYDSGTGRAYVYLGSATGLSETASTTLTGETAEMGFGHSVSGAGDVDGDGYDDVIVGAPYDSSYTGLAYVYLGSAGGLSETPSATLTGESTDGEFGGCVSDAGDVNGDGYADVIVGAYNYGNGTGRAYVYTGSASGLSTTAGTTLSGEAEFDDFAGSVSGAGDVNGDGYDDVIVGAYKDGSLKGEAYVYLGSASGVSATASTTMTGESPDDYYASAVAGAGDVNGDGYDDVIVGARSYHSNKGRVYLYPGSADGVVATADTTLTGDATDPGFGLSVSAAGDVDGDGYDDIIVGAPYYTSEVGRAYVFSGYADADGDGTVATEDCDDSDPTVTTPSARYVDADGDGYGSSSTGVACPGDAGYSDVTGDCDDSSAAVNPGATEICNGVDDDCDGFTDQDAADANVWYADADGDGYTNPDDSTSACDQPDGYAVSTEDDCDDSDATVYPGATDIPGDGIDQDCDGADATAGDTDTSTDTDTDKPTGCTGCSSTSGDFASGWVGILFALGLARRRR